MGGKVKVEQMVLIFPFLPFSPVLGREEGRSMCVHAAPNCQTASVPGDGGCSLDVILKR